MLISAKYLDIASLKRLLYCSGLMMVGCMPLFTIVLYVDSKFLSQVYSRN